MHRALIALFAMAAIGAAQNTVTERDRLLKPKALANAPGPISSTELRRQFAKPPAEYGSMPLWVWNDQLDWNRLKEQLGQFKQQGIGGVFVHPRPGLMTEYLGTDWFRLWKLSIEEGKRLGMTVNIYDENSYPSGFSGGYVPSRAPDTAAQYVQVDMDINPRSIFQNRGVTAGLAAVKMDAKGNVVDAKGVRSAEEIPQGYKLIGFRLRRASGNPWTGGFPYVDLTNPQTTPLFLETTYERYKKEIGPEFGKTVRWAFTDEPLIATGGAYDTAAMALPMSMNTLSEFRKRNGYDLADNFSSLYWDVGDFRKVRFDYWQTLHDLWKENFMRPMFEWCDRNGLQFTGHWMEHEWPAPWITPADANLYAYEHVPGIDMLEGANIRATGKDAHMLFTIRQMASVSHQLGRRAFCEAYGVAGWDSTLEHYKRFGDWLMAHGVNFVDQHLAFATVRGARKRDHPQSFTDVSPWWPYYRLHADHLTRVSFVSSRGESRNRLLVLQQTTSGYLLANRAGVATRLLKMRATNAEMNQFLADNQVDYDLGDEYMIEWFGAQKGKQFAIAKAKYDLLLWPPDMDNVRKETIPHLREYLAAGGQIVALSAPARYVDGRPNDAVQKLAAQYAAQWKQVSDLNAALAAVRERLAPRVAFDNAMPMVGVLERYLPDGARVLFMANTGLEARKARATVEGGSVEVLDTLTGEIAPARFTAAGGKVSFDVELAPAGSAMYMVKAAAGAPAKNNDAQFTAVAASEWKVRADAPNVLVLDYCDLTSKTHNMKDVNTWQANWSLWQGHGFERPAWDNAVQFQTRIFDRNHFEKDSGFDATFRFDVADAAALKGLQLATETPEQYRITVNGKAVDFKTGTRWMDPHIRLANIEALARAGENTVTISAHPFKVTMELENVYLRGNFAVEATSKGFRLTAPRALDFGYWNAQGYPFYADAVTYETEVTVPAGANRLRVELPRWSGSVAAVLLDGKQAGTIAWQPFRSEFAAAPGKHKLAVKVVSTPRNVFGPYHHPSKPRMRSWPAAWAAFPEHQPAGAAYDFVDYGLPVAPLVSAATQSR